MTCSCRWFIQPETAISRNWNGSRTLWVFKAHYREHGATAGNHRRFMQIQYSGHTGTEIKAANSGRAAIVRDMYFEGGLIVIDHGESILTLYMHLSECLVKEGAAVENGQPIAKSGSSGRATGPHLHFAVQWQGSYLEPSTLLRLWT